MNRHPPPHLHHPPPRLPHPTPRPLAALLAAAILAAPALPAGSTPQHPRAGASEHDARQVFAERIEVRVVNLEAVVVDKDDRRVGGLASGHFRLRVDGKEVPIEFFTEIAEGHSVEKPAAGADGARPSATAAPAGVEPGQAVGTNILLFVDDYLTFRPADRNLVLDKIGEQLAKLSPDDRMAIVSFNGRDLDVLADWTASGDVLAQAIEKEKARRPRGLTTRSVVRDGDQNRQVTGPAAARAGTEDSIGGLGPEGLTDENGLPLDLCSRIRRYEERLHRVVLGATATLRGFSRPPGRRVMMLLSGGWPQSARDYLAGGDQAPEAALRCHDEGPRLYQPIYATANLLGYTLYPVDVPQAATGGLSAETGGGTAADPRFGIESTAVDADFQLHATLERLGAETGGKALLGGARLDALARVVDDTRSYYWLGFTPSWQGDDREHKIELTATQPGLKVRSRAGFQDLSRSTEVSVMVESALLFDNPPGIKPLEVRLGTPGRGKNPQVPVEVVIPMDEVTMLPEGDHYVAHLELRIAVLDESGDQNEIAVIPVELKGPAPPPGSHAVYDSAVKLRRERHDLVISLYDPLSDTLLAAKTRFEP